MRAGFTSEGLDRPVQFVAAHLDPPVDEVDLGDVPAAEIPERVEAALAADRAVRFDVTRPPLFRLLVVRAPDHDRLVINRHQLVWDGWSAWLVIGQLLTAYAGREIGPVGSYRDYLGWLGAQDHDGATAAWRAAMAGLEEPTLVGDTSSDVPVTVASGERHAELSAEDSERLRELTRTRGVTANGVLAAAWGLTLGVLTGRTDVVFGTVVAGRNATVPGVDTATGLFMNTVPFRTGFRAGESVADALTRLQDERLATMPYEFVGLGDIQRASGHRRLFDTLFVYRLEGGDDQLAALRDEHGVLSLNGVDHTHFPLNLVVTPGERIDVMLSHAVDDDAAAAVLDRYVGLLRQMLADPDRATGLLDPLLDAERTAPAGAGDAIEIGTETVADMLAERAALVPDEIALVQDDARLTYAELDAAVNRTARMLLERGAGPERVVALAVPRSVETVIALFAVLRTGAAYLPLELDHPAERLLDTLADAAPVLLVTVGRMADALAPSGVPALVLDDPGTLAARERTDPAPLSDDELGAFRRDAPDRLERPAYLIYTSGSTGKPKGVVTPHRGLTNMQLNHRREIFDPVVDAAGARRLRIAHTVSFAFDMSWEELLWLVEGHEVHVCDEELRRDADALVAYCAEHAVDVVNVTPTYAAVLFDTGLLDGPHPPPLVLLGGEAVSDAVWDALRDKPGVLGYNLYGPTEYTINTLGAGTGDSDTPTVGRPITNTAAHVLDPWLRPVPHGTPGELYIAGAGLARGYLDRFGLTAERFVADPSVPGGRMYRTGDLVRRGPDGMLDFLGRTDDQVKIRGHRVEPGEVASVLSGHDAVARAAVVADSHGGLKRLVGYVVPAAGADPTSDELRRHLRERLPEHMVPAAVVVVEGLPLTVNGKLDVASLPVPDPVAGSGRPPKGAAEEALAGLFAEVLDVRTVGADDSFFDLGGHSLLATRLLSRVRRALSAELALRDLFEAPTVAELAVRIDGHSGPARPELTVRERPERLPLSAAQQRLWMLQQLEAGSAAYNFPIVLRLTGALDAHALRAALSDVADRHEALRTVFSSENGVPVQRVLDLRAGAVRGRGHGRGRGTGADPRRAGPAVRPGRRGAAAGDPAAHGAGDARAGADAAPHHDRRVVRPPVPVRPGRRLPRAPVGDRAGPRAAAGAVRGLRALAPRAARRPVRPGLRRAHAARVVGRRARRGAGRAGAAVRPSAARAPVVPWRDRAHRPRRRDPRRRRGARGPHRGEPVPGAARLRRRVPAPARRGGRHRARRTGRRTHRRPPRGPRRVLREHARAAHRRVRQPGRRRAGGARARRRPGGVLARRRPVRGRRGATEPAAHTGPQPAVPGDGRLPRPHRGGTGAGRRHGRRGAGGGDVGEVRSRVQLHRENRRRNGGTDVDGGLTLGLEYASDLYDEPTAARLASRFARFTAGLLAGGRGIGDVDVLDDAERALVLDGFNATGRPVGERTLIEAFERNVAERPDAVAVVDGDRTVTYAELDGLADGVAALLAGVGPEHVVGVAVPRSVEVVASVLGVLKRGAAFLPLDLSHPAERITFMLEDSGASALLATAEQSSRVETEVPRVLLPDNGITPGRRAAYRRPSGVDHAAYVIYTSGSTGRPKGAVLTHDGIASLAATAVDRMGVGADSVVLQFASIGFDVFVFELVQALHEGGRLVVLPDDARVAGPALTSTMEAAGVTHAILPPSLVAALPADQVIPDGTTVLVGTEVVPPHVIERWAGPLRLLGAYGLTEATVNSTLWDAVPGWEGPTPIGVPDPNTRTYVLDERLAPVPPGVAGDLYVAGRGLARGYTGRPALTAERFVPCPFGGPGERMYRTGDRARWRADGNLDFLGRSDAQLKVRGFRIEPGEVAAALASHEDVAQAAVLPDRHGDVVRLVGYASPAEGASPDPVTLRALTSRTGCRSTWCPRSCSFSTGRCR